MNTNSEVSDFISMLPKGSHVTCIYSSIEDLTPIIIPFIKKGLLDNEQCLYTHDQIYHNNIKAELSKNKINPEEIISSNKLVLQTSQNVYGQFKSFDGDALISQIKQMSKSAKESGFNGLRAIGNSSWLKNQSDDIPNFMKYESKVNQVFEDLNITTLCLYNQKLFSNQTLVDVVRTHKYIFYQGRIIQSKYFAPSDNFIPLTGTKHNNTEKILSSIFS